MHAPSNPSLSRLLSRLHRLARLSYALAAALAVATLWGWVLGLPRLRDLGADFSPMPPGACLAFVLLACSFFEPRPRVAWIASGVAAAATLVSLVPLGFVPETLAPAPALAMMLLALGTPLARELERRPGDRQPRVLRLPVASAVAVLTGGIAFFALLGLSLRMLRLDIAAQLLGF